ncbi:sulfotransferase family 2 domain-containing protein [Profundibacterium mesophilum]|uniref:Sulfotransferase family domain containing protein n=1 Tax=Profundibacterium mesophilum KAUST100406-0324 TaxID=1037889 RepID=A0A921NPM0_9RHOB|nr:sulfotransferase family 2 domain-containing protein [Profundibacterium mesophilum]KAF0674522.1 Sulfotransferase family domain containing protein [Profundibacterium mesophilum KAUST100406-0324]
MIISPGRRYIFVHIPKTAGTSFAAALEARAMKDDVLVGDTPKALRRRGRLAALRRTLPPGARLWKHSRLADIETLLAPGALDGYEVVTLIRNPWDRMVSYYHWLRRQEFGHPAVLRAAKLDFDGFVRDEATRAAFAAESYGAYLRVRGGREVPARFVRIEHLADDLAPFEAHLGFALAVPHLNASDRAAGYRDFYGPRTRDLVAACCAQDIARFGYGF